MKKKYLLGLGLPLTLIPAALVSCSSFVPSHINKELVIRQNTPPQKNYDFELVNESAQTDYEEVKFTGTHLVLQKVEDDAQMESTGKVLNYSKVYYKLDFAEAFYITKQDDSVVVYNSDEHEIEGEVFSKLWKVHTSSVATSINNQQFLIDLQNAKKLQVGIKKGVKWINSKGEATEFEVIPENYYASWKSILQRGSEFRYGKVEEGGGGSKELDDRAADAWKNLRPNASNFLPNGHSTSNDYLYTLFGVDIKKLSKKESFIQKLPNSEENAITLEAIDEKEGASFKDVFSKMFVNSTFFQAWPNEYTAKNPQKSPVEARGEVRDFGYYWYGGKWEDMLFAGPYYPTERTPFVRKWRKNPFYHNQEWVKSEDSVNNIIQEYKELDPISFNDSQFQLFKSGYLATVNWNDLSIANKNEVILNPKDYNINFISSSFLNSIARGYVTWMSTPSGKLKKGDSAALQKRYYNDAFAKLMWGKTISEIESEKVPSVNKHFAVGDGLVFRTLLSNVFNMWTYAVSRNFTQVPWISSSAPGNSIGGSNQIESKLKLLEDAYDDINTSFAVGLNGQKVGARDWKEEKKHYDKPESQKNNKLAFQSSKYDEIKAEMKKLLDKFYSENPSLKNQKINFRFLKRFGNTSSKFSQVHHSLAEIFNSLDPRLEIEYKDERTDDDWAAFLGFKTAGAPQGWGYDYDGIGTWLNGVFFFYSRRATHIPILYEFGALSPEQELTKTFPQLYKLGKAVKDHKPFYPEGAPSFEQIRNGTIEDLLQNTNNFFKGKAKDYDPGTEWSKFFFKYQKENTNEDLVALAQEVNVVLGFYPASVQGVIDNSEKPKILLKSPNYYEPVLPDTTTARYDQWKIVKQAKTKGEK